MDSQDDHKRSGEMAQDRPGTPVIEPVLAGTPGIEPVLAGTPVVDPVLAGGSRPRARNV